MNYIIKINGSGTEDKLKEIGEITYESILIKGLYCVTSDLTLKQIQRKRFIEYAEIEMVGRLDV